MNRNVLAVALWTVGAILALFSIPAPNGFPLLLAAVLFYAAGWAAYRPKVRNRR